MNIIIVGGKGNGTVVLATILDMVENYNKDYNFIGFVNNNFSTIKKIDGYPVIGDFEDLKKICLEKDAYFINAITSVNTIARISQMYQRVFPMYEDRMISIIHPDVFIGYNVKLGKGVYLGAQSYVGQNVRIENMVFIHSQCYIARDAELGKYSYLAPKVYVGAESIVKQKVYFGINALIRERLIIEENTVIGMGSVVVANTEKNSLYYGVKAEKRN